MHETYNDVTDNNSKNSSSEESSVSETAAMNDSSNETDMSSNTMLSLTSLQSNKQMFSSVKSHTVFTDTADSASSLSETYIDLNMKPAADSDHNKDNSSDQQCCVDTV